MSAAHDEGLQAGVPADDRGLAYGDGVFETLAHDGANVLAVDAHLERLERGARALGFEPPAREHLRDALAGACGPGPGVLKVIVTRGSGGRGYAPPPAPQPRVRVSRHPWPDGIAERRAVGVHAVRLRSRLAEHRALAGLKHLNRLDHVLAAAELAARTPAHEGLMCDQSGSPVCGVASNLFVVTRSAVVTPDVSQCGVAGTIREALLTAAGAHGLPPVEVRRVSDRELDEAAELFLTNSVRGVLPVRCLDERDLGAPGPVARAALRWLEGRGLVV